MVTLSFGARYDRQRPFASLRGQLMPRLREYRVFISHAWSRSHDYSTVVSFLDSAPYFLWENLSVPEHDPVPVDTLMYDLRAQMRPAEVFLILAGMYVNFSDWIDFELSFARRIGRPIVGIVPRGQQVTPAAVQRAAREMVGWTTNSIVGAIRRHALPTGSR